MNWTLAKRSLNLELFFSDKICPVEIGNSKFSKCTRQSTDNFYDTGNINHNQLAKSYKMVVSFVLSNAELPALPTLFLRLFFLYLIPCFLG